LVALVAALPIYFLVLEMFLRTKPLGLKTFRNSPEKATDTAVLAANQGLYNGFLAAGLIWAGVTYRTSASPVGLRVPETLCYLALAWPSRRQP
jgi:putative membrane protein